MEDRPGKRVLGKIDSGPGRSVIKLLVQLKLLEFILYPGVPNTTADSQETDRLHNPFKAQLCINLDELVQNRIENIFHLICNLGWWV